MDSKTTYHQQMSYCGKARCRKCHNGAGHGPYWYSYQTVNGRIVRTYVGKELPPEAKQNTMEANNIAGATPTPTHQNVGEDKNVVAGLVPAMPLTPVTQSNPVTMSPAMLAQVGRVHRSPLIGRDKERTALYSLLRQVERNQNLAGARSASIQKKALSLPLDTLRSSQCTVLMGEAGIGKTRLAEEVGREAQRRGWAVLWSRAYAQESGIPYRVWTEVLRKAFQLGIKDAAGRISPERNSTTSAVHYGRGDPLWSPWEGSGAVSSTLQPLASLLPELGSTQNFPTAVSLIGPEQEQLRLREAVRELLTKLSEKTPLLIVLDDIQWADGSSLQLLGYLARHLHDHPILLLGTCRDSEAPRSLHTLIDHMQREHTITTLHLDPLTSEEIGRLVSHTSQLSESSVRHIQEQASGNPFFAEELARGTPPKLPDTIAAALDSRLNSLSNECRTLLRNAAVLGGSFEFPVIYEMEMKRAGEAADEETLFDLLDEALESGVLTEEGTGSRVTYTFWHPLLVSHLYERVSAIRRTQIHRRVAEILQRIHKAHEEEVAATITHHLVNGGAEPSQIAHYAELAGNRAYALLAYPETERYYKLAIENLENIGNMAGLAPTMPTPTISHLAYLTERLAECTMIQGKFVEARSLFERVLALRELSLQQLPPISETARQYEAQIQALLWGEIGRTWRYAVYATQARQCCERGEQVLRNAGVIAGPAWAKLRYQQSGLYSLEGRYDEGLHMAQEALSMLEQHEPEKSGELKTTATTHTTRIQRTLEGDPIDFGRTYVLLGSLANSVGQLDAALAHLKTALAIFERYDQKREIANVSCNIGYVYIKMGKYKEAQHALNHSLSLAERIGDGPISSVVFSNFGELEACHGNLDEAEEWYKRSLALAERFNDRKYISMWNAELAVILQEQGKQREATICVIQALTIGRTMKNTPSVGGALIALGKMRVIQAQHLSTSDKFPKLRTHLLLHARKDVQRALALQGLEAEARTKGQLVLAHVSLLLGETEKAKRELEKALAKSHQYGLALIEQQAKELLHG